MVPNPTRLHRITHIDNLQGIMRRGGICAPNFTPNDGIAYKTVHHQHIQSRRANAPVPCGPGGTIHDYVPFYFAPRPPMLYAICRGNVAGYTEGQTPLIYLVGDAQDVPAAGLGFVFTDGHAVMAVSEFFDDLSHLDRVDWSVMRSKWWNDTPQTPDRCRRRQAEFLIHRLCPITIIRGIAVRNEVMKSRVEEILAQFPNEHHPIAKAMPGWYYSDGAGHD